MAGHAALHPLRVAAIQPLTDDAVALTLELPDDLRDDFAWTAGQHLTFACDDGVRRSYSICTPPASGRLTVGIRQLPEGAFSTGTLAQLQVGDALEVMTPAGRFTAVGDPTRTASYVAIAAGSGITPILSIVTHLLETEPGSQVTLVYANRDSRSVMFLDEVHDLKDRFLTRFRLVHVLSREEQDGAVGSGRLTVERFAHLRDRVFPGPVDAWFLCGPMGLVTSLRDHLREQGESQVHTELFHADDQPPAAPAPPPDDSAAADASSVTVRLDGRSSTFPLSRSGVSVLEAALAVRSDAPYACRGGVCGTCRARVVEGSVRMDTNWALEDDEVERGYVLTCQAHPTSDDLLVDYDA